jgi:hypothetical protein
MWVCLVLSPMKMSEIWYAERLLTNLPIIREKCVFYYHISYMAMVRNFEVMCDEFNLVGIYTGGSFVYSYIINYTVLNLPVQFRLPHDND